MRALDVTQVLRSELGRLKHDQKEMNVKILENHQKIKQNKMLPYLVANVAEILDIDPDRDENDVAEGGQLDLDAQRKGKCAVVKTSTRQTVFLPMIGLVPADKIKPGDLVGVQKESYLILDTLPAQFDNRVKAMEVDEKPTETYNDIGGLDKQIEELVEAIVLPIKQADKFKSLGIKPPKGVLMYGPPGESAPMLAKATFCRKDLMPRRPSLSLAFIFLLRYRQDVNGQSLRCSDRSLLLEASRSFAGSGAGHSDPKVC